MKFRFVVYSTVRKVDGRRRVVLYGPWVSSHDEAVAEGALTVIRLRPAAGEDYQWRVEQRGGRRRASRRATLAALMEG